MTRKLFSENFDRSFPSGHVAKTLAAVTVLVSSVLFCVSANASCGQISPNSALSPQARSFTPMAAIRAMSRSTNENDQSNAVDADDSIVGFWDVRFLLPTGELFDEGFDQFHSDGLEILNDNGGGPQPANSSGTVCLGVFKKSGRGMYRVRHPFWAIDDRGDLSGTGVLLETIILDDHRTF